MKMTRKVSNTGYMLIEVMVATALIAAALVALVSRVTDAISVNRFSREKVEATKLANQAVEWIRGWRSDLQWDGFANEVSDPNATVNYCWDTLPIELAELQSKSGSCGPSVPDTGYLREVVLTPDVSDSDVRMYTVTVSWDDGEEEVVLTGELHRGEFE